LNFSENLSQDPTPDDAWDEDGNLSECFQDDWEDYQEEKRLFEMEKPTERVVDTCYAIIQEPPERVKLSLWEILKRLNVRPLTFIGYCRNDICAFPDSDRSLPAMCFGHERECRYVEFPFDGWALAFYVREWYRQFENGVLIWR
ncbi:MAG: hypothetical protein CEN88_387, partial [Candidatus Berkelbacteria bacterium Licking1014_2]